MYNGRRDMSRRPLAMAQKIREEFRVTPVAADRVVAGASILKRINLAPSSAAA
jgi:hypothetical protein